MIHVVLKFMDDDSIKDFSIKDPISKDLVYVVVEQALLEIGTPEFELVQSKLKQKYDCDISDCLTYPNHLKMVLSELYGDVSQIIIDSIEEKLQKVSLNQEIEEFLLILKH